MVAASCFLNNDFLVLERKGFEFSQHTIYRVNDSYYISDSGLRHFSALDSSLYTMISSRDQMRN
jgi:hypothetical protein